MLQTIHSLLLAQYSTPQWVLVFFAFSLAGWCWEVLLYLVRERRFVNRGFLSGPILPIYGFGAVCILVCCMPVREHALLVALIGMLSASLLEYATGAAMEALFHVRYWDYSSLPFNLKGHICLYSAATWAVFSVLLVCFVHPKMQPVISRIPDDAAWAASLTLGVLAVGDAVRSVRRALSLRRLLETMERCAQEMQALRGDLSGISERMGDMIRAFAVQVDEKRSELAGGLQKITQAQDHVRRMLGEKQFSLEHALRFAELEKILSDAAAFLPDARALREEIERTRERYEHQFELLHRARLSGLSHARKVLSRNPSAVSRRHGEWLEEIRKEK